MRETGVRCGQMPARPLLSKLEIPRLAEALATKPEEEAAAEFGVERRTLRRWMQLGRERPGTVYGELVKAVELATARDDGRLTEKDVVVLLEKAARRGSVRAMELLLRRQSQLPKESPVSGLIDELARRRAQR
jgi:hypothetical protein